MGISDKEGLESALQQINGNQKKLTEIFQHNHQVYSGAFEITEMHQWVTRRVLNDMFVGKVKSAEATPGIDWSWYYSELQRCCKDDVDKGLQEFCGITFARALEPTPEGQPDFVFGGDNAR